MNVSSAPPALVASRRASSGRQMRRAVDGPTRSAAVCGAAPPGALAVMRLPRCGIQATASSGTAPNAATSGKPNIASNHGAAGVSASWGIAITSP